jgi:hypothetical protein
MFLRKLYSGYRSTSPMTTIELLEAVFSIESARGYITRTPGRLSEFCYQLKVSL